jgi:Carboxypeptidase regulatory-like domain
MKRSITTFVVSLIVVVVSGLFGSATTCVANKRFKVNAVCGTVTDPSDVPIPKVDVELLDDQSAVLQRAVTNEEGHFSVSPVPKGEYVLRVKSPYFVVAWQPIIVTKNNANARCKRAMQVRLGLAGRCSSVSKPK